MRRLRPLAQVVMVGFALSALTHLVCAYYDLDLRSFADKASRSWSEPDMARAARIDAARSVSGMVNGGLRIVTLALFLVWLWRAKANCRDSGAPATRCSPAMAVVVWFIPIINLYRPYHAVVETVEDSVKMAKGAAAGNFDFSGLTRMWWFIWLVGALLGMIGLLGTASARTPSGLASAAGWAALGNFTNAIAAVPLIVLIRLVTRYQESSPRPGSG